MRDISPPSAELLQKVAHALAITGHHLTITLYEDESVRIVTRFAGHVARIGLGVPW